jgi:hypothetical protein
MAIKPKCDKCGNKLIDFGAILLSPPDNKSHVIKFHLCKSCYRQVRKTLK